MWASIAMNTSSNDDSFSESSCTSSSSSASPSDTSSSGSCSSWDSFSSSSTATPYPNDIDPSFNKPMTLKKSLLVDYSKSASRQDQGQGRGSFQLSPRSSPTSPLRKGTSSDDHSIAGNSLHSIHSLPFPRRHGATLSSSSSRLQQLMVKSSDTKNRRASTGMRPPSFVRATSKKSTGGNPIAFNRRRTLERKQLIQVLEQALQQTSPDADADDDDDTENVTFQLKKNAGIPSALTPPSLKQSTSNTSRASNTSTLNVLLKESRRENLEDMLAQPKKALRHLNKSSLVDSFRPVSAIGVNQRKRHSSITTMMLQRALGAKIAAAVAAKAATMASFHEGIRDFGSMGDDDGGDDTTTFKTVTNLQTSSSLGSLPSTVTATSDTPAAYFGSPSQSSLALVHKEAFVEEKRPSYGSSKSRSLKDARLALQDVSGASIHGGKKIKQRELMRRSLSAPRNSLKSISSGRSFAAKSANNARSTARSKESSEIAALQALVGKSHRMRRRSSCTGAGGIPTSITILNRSSSSDSPFPPKLKRSSSSDSYCAPKVGAATTTMVSEETVPPLPAKSHIKSLPDPNVNGQGQRNVNANANANTNRRTSLTKIPSHRRTSQQTNDSSISDVSSNGNQRRHFQRVASFSSRKSFSLMIQNANLQDSSQDFTATTLETTGTISSSGASHHAAAVGTAAWANHRRSRRALQRAESRHSMGGSGRSHTSGGCGREDEDAVGGERRKVGGVTNRRAIMKRQTSAVVGSRSIRTLRS